MEIHTIKCCIKFCHLSFCRWLNVRVTAVTNDIIHFSDWPLRDVWKGVRAVVCIVSVYLPAPAKICRTLNHHSGRPKGLTNNINRQRKLFIKTPKNKKIASYYLQLMISLVIF